MPAPRAISSVLAAAAVAAAFAAPAAHAAGSPDIAAGVSSSNVLFGSNARVAVSASNPAGQPYGYNLSFRVVLPAGVSYAGGAPVAPTQVAGPSPGQTTLLFSNLSDLSPNSSFDLGFDVAYSQAAYNVGSSFQVAGQAFVNSDPRYVPKFNPDGTPNGPSATSYTGYSAVASGTQTISAIKVGKSEPSPEGELLRGLHDHQTVYTVSVTNNGVNPTTGVTVEDYLPAGLEFLGCGNDAQDDNTTDAPTNPGSPFEYTGSGPIVIPALAGCVDPVSVSTEVVDPDGSGGPMPSGVYTHVTWDAGSLSAGQVKTFTYRAAVPIRANTNAFTGPRPTAASGNQGANLDNNSGPDVADESALVNRASAAGTYQGPSPLAVTDATTLARTAEDWVVRKAASSGALVQGAITTWTLTFQTSEYRYVDNATITDTLPSGLCPLSSTTNFTSQNDAADSECAPVAATDPSAPYKAATENADGTWTLTWDKTVLAALAHTNVNDTLTLTFPTRTRGRYQQNFLPTMPILARDSISNAVSTSAEGWARCTAPGTPDCATAGPPISRDGTNGGTIADASGAGQAAPGPAIDKRVAASGTDCQAATYVSTIPTYHPGDRICWKVRVDFPAFVDTQPQAIADYLPAGVTYEAGSDAPAASNTVAATLDATQAASGLLTWSVTGGTVPTGSRVFERVLSTIAAPTGTIVAGDVPGNLLKFSSTNTAGASEPLRDQADYAIGLPQIALTKGVQTVERGASVVDGPYGANVDNRPVQGGDKVTYRVDVRNSGQQDAVNVDVRDLLPADYDCAFITAISDGGTCTDGGLATDRVDWTVASLPAGQTKTLTYTATVPASVGPGRTIANTAGVREYEGATNLGGTYLYTPANNIDPSNPNPPNVPRADDPSNVATPGAAVVKARATEVTESGNTNGQATIGEEVTYTLTATIPAGTTLGGTAQLTDAVDSSARQPYVAGSATATLNGTPLPAGGLTLDTSGATPKIVFPANYANAPGSGDDTVVLTFKTKVADVGANTRTSASLTNQGTLSWTEPALGARTAPSNTVTTQIVEPLIAQAKADDKNPNRVAPDDIVTYTVTTSNSSASRVSTAHDVQISDAVPAGLTPVGGAPGNVPLNDGDAVPGSGGAVWNAGPRTITKTVATIAPNASSAFSYRAKVDNPAVAGSSLTNTVSSTATSLGSPQDADGERTAGAGYAATATDTVRLAIATVTKSVTPATATIGDAVSYDVLVTIPASVSLYDVTVTDTVPDGIDVDGYSAEACQSGCPLVNAVSRYTPVVNGNGTTTVAWDFGDIATPLGAPQVVKLTYAGHVRATKRNGGASVVSGNTLANSVAVASNRTNQDGPFNAGSIPTGFDDTSPTATSTATVAEPRIGIDKKVKVGSGAFVDGPATAQSDDPFTYQLVVTNTGTSPAYDVQVTDQPDAELANVVPVSGAAFVTDGWTAGDPDLKWTIPGPIAPNASVTLTYTASLVAASGLSDGQQIDNTAAVPHYFGVPEATRTANPTWAYRDYTDGGSDATKVILDFPTLATVKTTGLASFPDTGSASVEQNFPWRVVVTNTSATATASNVVIRDTLPANWSYAAGSATLSPGGAQEPTVTPNAGGDVLDWTVASLGPGASVTVAFQAKPAVAAGTTPGLGANAHVNSAKVASATDEAGNTGNAGGPYATPSDTAAATLAPFADVSVTKTVDPAAILKGGTTTFTLTVRNAGPSTAQGVSLADTLPAGLTFLSSDTPSCQPASGTVTCPLPDLPAGGSAVVKITATGVANGDWTNAADVTTTTPEPPGGGNPNHAEAAVNVGPVTDLALTKAGPATVDAGGKVTWTLQVTNHGPDDATGVTIVDTLPAGTVFASADPGCTAAGPTVTCAIGALAADASVTRTISATVPAALGSTTIVNTATVSGSQTDPRREDNSASFPTTVGPSTDLAVVKTGPAQVAANGTATWTLLVTNGGPSAATGVTVTDTLPAGLTSIVATPSQGTCQIADRTLTCAAGSLAPAGSMQIQVQAQVPVALQGSSLVNTAAVGGTEPDPNPGNNTSTTTTPVGPPDASDFDLALTKTVDDTPPPEIGKRFRYTVTVRNSGPAPAASVTVLDTLPSAVEYVSATVPGGRCAYRRSVVTCRLGSLASGATRAIAITVLPVRSGRVRNTASVGASVPDRDPANNRATATTRIAQPRATLRVVKTASATAPLAPGTKTRFRIRVTNTSTHAAAGVRVCDRLPASLTYVSAPGSQFRSGNACWDIGFLAAGASRTFTIVVRIDADVRPGTVRNIAVAGADNALGAKGSAPISIAGSGIGGGGGVTG